MKHILMLVIALLTTCLTSCKNTNAYLDTERMPDEDHVAGVMLVRQDSIINNFLNTAGRYILLSSSVNHTNDYLDQSYFITDFSQWGVPEYIGTPYNVVQLDAHADRGKGTTKSFECQWALIDAQPDEELNIWLVVIQDDYNRYAYDTGDKLKVNGPSKEYSFSYTTHDRHKELTHNVDFKIAAIAINEIQETTITEYDASHNVIKQSLILNPGLYSTTHECKQASVEGSLCALGTHGDIAETFNNITLGENDSVGILTRSDQGFVIPHLTTIVFKKD